MKRLILIDDDKDFCQLTKEVCDQYGFCVDFFHSFNALKELSKIKNYDAAIFDHFLEGTSGLELANHVDYFYSEIPVFIVTAHAEKLIDKDLPPSVIQLISKNTSIEEIVKTISRILARRDFLAKASLDKRFQLRN